MKQLCTAAGTLLATFVLLPTAVLAQSVFINEIHYDNDGTDQGEAIEIAGPAGTDLSGWSIVLYNGSSTQRSPYTTTNLSGSLAAACGGLGVSVINYPTNGIQNGAPDGIALVDAGGTVVQFLSYEGHFEAASGPAAGMTSTDIGVSESSGTAVGDSLQLTGDGVVYSDFAWTGPVGATFGACNTGQTSGGEAPAPELLLSEIVVTPTGGEFIEIYNPGFESVDLGDVYLTDATFAGGSVYYYNIVTGSGAGGGGFSDFHARFPDGASIAPGEYQTVALAGSEGFELDYGIAPTYELYEDSVAADTIPDMREAFAGSINDQGGLTNSGEVVVLYSWDGESDLVADLDYAVWGDKAEAVDKTGIGIDGPDADSDISFYADDTDVAGQDVIASSGHVFGQSFSRVDLNEGTEVQTGGNGVAGDDETSENLSVTWAERDPSPNTETAPPPPPPATLLLNEFQADPASGSAGDANGDGTRDSSEDEFIELVNISGADLDISGWTIADGFSTRHTFPAGTVLTDQCAIVVFGGGAPTGLFGNAEVQTASGGSLGLNNGGDTITVNDGSLDVVTVSYGGEGGNNQALNLDPDLTGTSYALHTNLSGGTLYSPGTLVDGNVFPGCEPIAPTVAEIFEIQGDGPASPLNGALVTTEDNIVTVVGTEGFFIQTPAARSDDNIDTSDGIYVFTGTAPAVSVGDQVDVTGTVVEFFDFTEISGVTDISVDSSGNALPAAVVFDANVPSTDPTAPSCAIEFECYEGMLIDLPLATVSAPNQSFGTDPVAEVYVKAGLQRAFREPGIEFPGLPGLPVWDGNPEVFELDADKLGLTSQLINAGSQLSATGALGFEFGGYELWASSLAVIDRPLPESVRTREAAEMTVGSLNLLRLFDDMDDPAADDPTNISPEEYAARLAKFSLHIRTVMDAPDVLAVQEVESLAVLDDLAMQIAGDDASISYTAYLEEGNDVGGIDVGFLVRDSITVDAITQLGADETLSVDGSPLHDRPPLLLEGRNVADGSNFPIAVMALHNRSLSGIDSSRTQIKRLEQAQSIAWKVQDIQSANPDVNLVVTGDYNAYQFTDGYVDVVGQIRGDVNPDDNLRSGPELVDPVLTNVVDALPDDEQYSFIFRGNAQVLDHALVNQALLPLVTDFQFGRANTDAPEILFDDPASALAASDHDGLVLFLIKDSDGDTITDDVDQCAGTMIPEAVPTRSLGVNHFALVDGDTLFDTRSPNGEGPQKSFSLEDTAGCSCEQIIDAMDLGNGQRKAGCSIGTLEDWIDALP